ncbi:TetR/AcrR family transcriptional regulator [Streptomyces sp. Ag109_O5-1]|uniref:TetR/AcrR family transcriptional regulator n=1 Tax=Streptomyces sp. Ag109_O5-1 TaxID=1938851 RepID=UPI000F507205|nr:TetR/AcrR family transcriptional regulator [Streptomyces sp. Ag109_O5-1]
MSASAAPHGYTLALWAATAVMSSGRGTPGTGEVLALLAGATFAFVPLAAVAYGGALMPPDGTAGTGTARARIPIGSLHQYQPNKDAILVELVTRHPETGMAAAQRRTDETLPESLEEVIRGVVRTSIGNHLCDPQLLRVLAEQAPRSPELLEAVARNKRERVACIRGLPGIHPEVRVEDTYVAARPFVSTAEFLVHQLIAEPNPVDITRLENELVAMLTRYLTTAPPGS